MTNHPMGLSLWHAINEAFQRELHAYSVGAAPRMDISESNSAIDILVELPGFTERDVILELENGVLTINAEKRFESFDRSWREMDKNWLQKERSRGPFNRSIFISYRFHPQEIHAEMASGLLFISVPIVKSETVDTQNVTVDFIRDIKSLRKQLSQNDQRIIDLCFDKKLTGQEMAAVLGVSQEDLMSRMFNLQKKLAELFGVDSNSEVVTIRPEGSATEAERISPPEESTATIIYPRALIRAFAVGVGATLVGIVCWIVSLVVHGFPIELGASILLAFGTVIVAMTLLRGEELEEKHVI